MGIKVTCDCGKEYEVPESLAGKTGKCADCGVTFTVPLPPLEPPPISKPEHKAPRHQASLGLAIGYCWGAIGYMVLLYAIAARPSWPYCLCAFVLILIGTVSAGFHHVGKCICQAQKEATDT